VAAEGIVWMLCQPPEYTGWRESMYQLRHREGIMATRLAQPRDDGPTPTELYNGLYKSEPSHFVEPYN
jgi:hypothetical protein